MSFKNKLIDLISTVSKILIPLLLIIIGSVLGLVIMGFLGEAIWLGLVWCLGRIWKILLAGIIIFIIICILANN